MGRSIMRWSGCFRPATCCPFVVATWHRRPVERRVIKAIDQAKQCQMVFRQLRAGCVPGEIRLRLTQVGIVAFQLIPFVTWSRQRRLRTTLPGSVPAQKKCNLMGAVTKNVLKRNAIGRWIWGQPHVNWDTVQRCHEFGILGFCHAKQIFFAGCGHQGSSCINAKQRRR